MIKLLTQIINDENTRQNLSTLRQSIKDSDSMSELMDVLGDYSNEVVSLLLHSDAKTRKNAALLMGDCILSDFLSPLVNGYKNEQQLFVKAAYLKALSHYDCSQYTVFFKERIATLSETTLTPENKKHIQEELRALGKLIVLEEGITPHTFTGYSNELDCIFLTNKLHKEALESQITEGTILPFLAGVRVITKNLYPLLSIRNYSQLLFAIPELTTVDADPLEAAKTLASSKLLEFLKDNHKENTPFYFRVELKSKMDLGYKSTFSKKLSSELESLTGRELINSTSNYEVELRLIANKLGSFNVLLKLCTIEDDRFDYRRESVAASIKASNCAQLITLAQDYMVPDAQVLDPFCGVGTMLMERQMVVKANTSYGIDFYAPAIEKAKINMEHAGQIIHFINRNFFDFHHGYLFDEIVTNMPFVTGHKSQDEIQELYEDFFPKAREVLRDGGRIIMYSHNPDLVREGVLKNKIEILEEFETSKKEQTVLFVLELK